MRILLILLFASSISFSQVTNSVTKGNIQKITSLYEKNGKKVSETMRRHYPIHNLNGVEYVSFLGKVKGSFSAQDFRSRGIDIGSRIKDIVSIRYPLDHLADILNESDLGYFKMAGRVKPLLDRVKIGTRVDSVWAGINLPQSYTGQGVIIGVQDWGFDFTHPMFYDTLLTNSRVLACFDQFRDAGPYPTGFNYGTEIVGFTDLQSYGSDTAGIYSYATHGSHVAGIAGGSGAGTTHRGMAFESEFIFSSLRIDESFAMDGWNWMAQYAQSQGKRLVINCSWGVYQLGALDGSDILAQALDALVDNDVLIVTSAGNNGDSDFHIKRDFANDTMKTRINIFNSGRPEDIGQDVHIWGQPGNSHSMQVIITDASDNLLASTPWYGTATAQAYLDTFLVPSGTDTIFFNISMDAAYPSNNCPYTRLQVLLPPAGYKIGLQATAASGTVHLHNLISFDTEAGNWGTPFSAIGFGSNVGDSYYAIGQPACAEKSLAVAAYNSEYYSQISGNLTGGSVAQFSSFGPLIDESLKPDVAAPGVSVLSSLSSFTDVAIAPTDSVQFGGTTYYFQSYSGTSMSSPATAGVAAIILESNPYLSAEQVKDIIIQTARTDVYTGAIPPHSTRWGWGKVNAYAAVQLALVTAGIENYSIEPSWKLFPNPAINQIRFSETDGEIEQIQIIDLNGKIVQNLDPELMEYDITQLQKGMYFFRMIRDGRVEQRKFIKQ